jgi:hypothetical protein
MADNSRALPAHMYRDPALIVKYEAELQLCFGCEFVGVLLGQRYCTRGHTPKQKCRYFKEKSTQ